MARAVEFLGRSYFSPGARGAFRAQPQPAGLSPDFNTLILIGASENGWNCNSDSLPLEKRVMEFGSSEEAVTVLGRGDLADAIANAFAPSRDNRFAAGPTLVKALCVSNNQHAAYSARTVLANNNLQIRAIVPGPRGNSTRVRVSSNGSIVQVGDASSISQSQPIVANEFSIQYNGNGTQAAVLINNQELRITLTGANDGSQNIAILLSEYATIGQIVDFINSRQGYQARVLSRPDRKSSQLDHIVAGDNVNIAGSSWVVTALLHEQSKFISGTGLAEVIPGESHNKPLSDMATFVYLTGGSSTNPQPSDWIEAIDLVYEKEVNGFFISLCTDLMAPTLHLADKLSVGNSPTGSFEKFGTSGLDTSKTIDERIDDIKLVNSEFLALGLSPLTVRQADRITNKTFTGWMAGVIHNAIKSSANLRETPTYKDMNIVDVPEQYSKTQINKIIQTGGLIVTRKPNRGPWKFEFALTSYQKNNIILNQTSIVCTALGLVKDFREYLQDTFLGEVPTDPDAFGGALTDADIRTAVTNRFRFTYVQQYGWLTRNIYTGENAFSENFTIQRDGDTLYFVFPDGKLVSPINFMFFLLNLDVVRGSSTGE